MNLIHQEFECNKSRSAKKVSPKAKRNLSQRQNTAWFNVLSVSLTCLGMSPEWMWLIQIKRVSSYHLGSQIWNVDSYPNGNTSTLHYLLIRPKCCRNWMNSWFQWYLYLCGFVWSIYLQCSSLDLEFTGTLPSFFSGSPLTHQKWHKKTPEIWWAEMGTSSAMASRCSKGKCVYEGKRDVEQLT